MRTRADLMDSITGPMPAKINFSVFEAPATFKTEPTKHVLTWPEFTERFSSHLTLPDKDGPGWSPALYPPFLTRKNENVVSITAGVLDFDHVDEAEFKRVSGLLTDRGLAYVVHTTWSHRSNDWNFRAIIPFTRPFCEKPQWPELWASLQHLVGQSDPIAKDLSRFYYQPATKPNQKHHTWVGEGLALDWSKLLAVSPPVSSTPRVAQADALDFIYEGNRNPTLNKIGGGMRANGLSSDEIFAALWLTNLRRCKPHPLSEAEVRKIAGSLERYSPTQPRSVVTISAADLYAQELPDPKMTIPGLLPEGLTILGGKPKMGKSWLCYAIGIAVASGGKALGTRDVIAGDVLYLSLEDNQRRLQQRLRKLLAGSPPPQRLDLATEWPRLDDGGIERLEEWFHQHPDARLVIVDTLARVRPQRRRGGNAYDEDYGALNDLKALADRHAVSVVVVTHLRKAQADDPLESITGTLGLTGGADGVLVLRRDRGNQDASLFVTGRDVEEQDLGLRLDASMQWSIIGDAADLRLSPERQAIKNFLVTCDRPVGPKEVATSLGEDHDGNIRALMTKMAAAGEITRVSTGLYTSNTHHTDNSGNTDNTSNTPSGHPHIVSPDPLAVSRVTGDNGVTGVIGVTRDLESIPA